jgi:hypothetical protein
MVEKGVVKKVSFSMAGEERGQKVNVSMAGRGRGKNK